jgi:hypothetical protein
MRKKVNSLDVKTGDIMVDVYCINDKIEALGHTLIVGHPTDMPLHTLKKLIDKCETSDMFIKSYSSWRVNPDNNFTFFLAADGSTSPIICFEKKSKIKYGLAKITSYDLICNVGKNKIDYIHFDAIYGDHSRVISKSEQTYRSMQNYINIDDIKQRYSSEQLFDIWANWITDNYGLIRGDHNYILEALYLKS